MIGVGFDLGNYLFTGKKHHSRRHHRAARPTSPYSTDSNFSAVVHKPYPKSQRKKQLLEQGEFIGLDFWWYFSTFNL